MEKPRKTEPPARATYGVRRHASTAAVCLFVMLPLAVGVHAAAEQQASPPQQAQQPQQLPQPQQQQQQSGARQARPQAAPDSCAAVPAHGQLAEVLNEVVEPGDTEANGGLGNPMWAVLVGRDGVVCAVARSGDPAGEQWPGSRTIAAAKAYAANGFSLPGFALSTANLYWPAQPGNSLYGMADANPLDAAAAYAGDPASWGTANDPLVSRRAGGTIAFGGGLALYTAEGELVGGLGLSGDESCTDHVIAWKMRHAMNLDNVPDGAAEDGNDNIIYDLTADPASGRRESASGYGHPECSTPRAKNIAEDFAETAPTGPDP